MPNEQGDPMPNKERVKSNAQQRVKASVQHVDREVMHNRVKCYVQQSEMLCPTEGGK